MVLQRVAFSDMSFDDLTELGVKERELALVEANLKRLTKGQTADTRAKIENLETRLTSIYECVNMDVRIAVTCIHIGWLNHYLSIHRFHAA